ncbi:serine hydroxymethyltransferase 2, mitochondrial-like [Lycium ferocissimum]|uniref:serine hydroxymethyltransferase 2, mitochondrial-like n=1 Tax=Lycium ferocissimum TaxID=112874 RepID=UPI002814D630|nr:serine hydroxymethyltransferase 2, mitochondrial-like [Lycium ferocissimum]
MMLVVRSIVTIIFSEGYRVTKYYGDRYSAMAVRLCQEHALEIFISNPAIWGLNFQLLTRPPTNFQVSIALLKPHEKCAAFFRPKLIVASASAYACLFDYACNRRTCNKKLEGVLLADMAHINGLVAVEVICSLFEYATVDKCATQFMGAQVYVLVVLEKRFFAFVDFDNEQHMFVDDPMDCATNTILDSNLKDKVLIEDGSIVMNQPKPNVETCRDVTQATVGLRNKTRRSSQRLIWDPGPISN